MRTANKISFNRSLFFCILVTLLEVSCGPSKKLNTDFIYFKNGADTVITLAKEILIQPNDLIAIQISSRTLNQEQAAIFNFPGSANSTIQTQGYLVNQSGNIDMPVIGAVKAAGLTKEELQISLVQKLTNYVKNPIVLIRFVQFNINVLGEVKSPGTHKFMVDKVTIIDALSAAGDLTDFGKREDVTVIREQEGKRIYHTVDLRNRNIFDSPVFFLQPNDIVYVGPNKNKLKNLNVDPDKQRRTSWTLAVLSILISIASIVVFALD